MTGFYKSRQSSQFQIQEKVFISKKIYKNTHSTLVSFFISLSLHLVALVALFSWQHAPAMKNAPQKISQQNSAIAMSLASFEPSSPKPAPQKKEISKKSAVPPKEQTPKEQTPQKQAVKKVHKPKKQEIVKKEKIQKIDKPKTQTQELVKKPETKEITPQKSTLVQNDTETKNKEQTPSEQTRNKQTQQTQIAQSSTPSADMLSHIRSLIQSALRYPPMARRLRIEGVVVVAFALGDNGEVKDANIITSSGNSSLDSRALQTVKELSGAYPRPQNAIDLQIPISFSIQNS